MKKPIIRHCKNCRYSNFVLNGYNHEKSIWCDVKYIYVINDFQRVKALFCPHYKRSDTE